jgi:iron(III) transport system ATP-binding protein
MSDIRLSLRAITKRFGSVRAVDSVSLDIHAGETFSFLGPSGCGKTTTLRMIAGLDVPDEGEILLDGMPIVSATQRIFTQPDKRHMGMVFQSYAIWPHMTVAENVAFPLRVRGVSRHAINDKVRNALDLVGLSAFADRPAPRLSGGQQQRVALARALVYEPTVLLLDEPMSNLDVKLREQMRVELKLLQQKLGLTLVYVTHDQIEALSLSDTIAVMSNGRTEQIGAPHDLYQRPATPFVRDFLGKSVTVRGRVVTSGPDGMVLEATRANGARLRCRATGMVPGQSVILSIRPEAITLLADHDPSETDCLVGTVAAILYQGERSECEILVGDERISAYLKPGISLALGQTVAVRLPAEHIAVWPAA